MPAKRTAILLLAATATAACAPSNTRETAGKSANGRYTVIDSDGSPVLLDTATGATWEGLRLRDRNNRMVFVYVRRLDNSDQIRSFTAEKQQPLPPPQ